jgi:N-acetylmuramoyl-L-alanine amidase
VAANAISPQVNSVTVSGGGSASANASDTTTITGSLIGSLDLTGNASGVGTVVKGSTLYGFGWAADTATGAPVQSVTVFVDGNSVGTATLGLARPDVASAYGRSDFTNSGWSFQMSTNALTTGTHTVTARAAGPSGTAPLMGSKTVNITTQGQEIGSVDLAGNASGVGTVGKGQTLYVWGWATDTASGAPVQSVTVFVDGSSVGTATLGLVRSDVASAYGRSDYTNSGWSFQMSTGALSLGQHTVTASAMGPSGTGQLAASRTVNITAQGQEIGVVDLAGSASGVGTLTKGSTLYVFGWAADTATGAPVQSVTVFVDGGSGGTATLGLARSDVAGAYGRSDYTNSGWSFQMSTSTLSLGQHTVTATAAGPSGTAPLMGSKTVNIQ